MKIAIVGVGTELTNGQILNSNAGWLSQKLSHLGFQINCHLVVPDNKKLILKALQFAAETSELIFVTGGLGPTSDDFTRDVISEFTGLAPTYDENSWQHIVRRLSSRGVPIRESQKQQCFYPLGSKVLTNQMGTANAFSILYNDIQFYVLPGPPKEIESVWNDHIQKDMLLRASKLDAYRTLIWETTGVGESEIAYLAEKALIGCPFEKAYRAHSPHVEVKLSFFASQSQDAKFWAEKLNSALKDYIISTDEI